MSHDDQLSRTRRKFFAGLGTAALGAVALHVGGALSSVRAQTGVDATSSSAFKGVPSVCVFDVNGSLLDTDSLGPLFHRVFGDWKVVREWYEELALYSNVIATSGSYPGTFIELGQAVLQMVADYRDVKIAPSDIEELKARILSMPAFPDVPEGLQRLKNAGFRLVTLTNSPPGPKGSEGQLSQAGIAYFFERHFNTEGVRSYKVAQSAYHQVAEEMDVPPAACCMITAHAWDALGAQFVGFGAGLMHRPGQASLFMPLLPEPQAVGQDLPSLAEQLIKLWRPS